MLNTDAHSPSMRKEKRMSEEDFINNLRGIDNGKDLDKKMLANVYNRVKNKEFKATDDHINQVKLKKNTKRLLLNHLEASKVRSESQDFCEANLNPGLFFKLSK